MGMLELHPAGAELAAENTGALLLLLLLLGIAAGVGRETVLAAVALCCKGVAVAHTLLL